MRGAAEEELGGFGFGFRESRMGMDAQGHIFGECTHFNCQHPLGNEAFGVATGDAHTENPSGIRIGDHFGQTIGGTHCGRPTAEFPGKPLDIDGDVFFSGLFFRHPAPGDLRVGVDHGRNSAGIKCRRLAGDNFGGYLAFAGGLVSQHQPANDIPDGKNSFIGCTHLLVYDQNQIRQALDAGDFDQAHSLVHNLKGLAGNLAATELQAAAVGLEKLVKGDKAKTPPAKELNLELTVLENALNQALESARSLGAPTEENIDKLSAGKLAEIPAELSQDIGKRIHEAAEMGDVSTLNAIAEEIKDQSDPCMQLSKQIIQMAEDFDLDGIQKLAKALSAGK